jgi:hypothetical protein
VTKIIVSGTVAGMKSSDKLPFNHRYWKAVVLVRSATAAQAAEQFHE